MSLDANAAAIAACNEWMNYGRPVERREYRKLRLSRRYKVRVGGRVTRCRVNYYDCPYCPRRFHQGSAESSQGQTIREHFRVSHFNFVPYRCHAYAVTAGSLAVGEHARHPELLGTHLTDAVVMGLKQAAERLRREFAAGRGSLTTTFAYVDAALLPSFKERLYLCGNCDFTSDSLLDYKRHVVSPMHLCIPLGSYDFPVVNDATKRSGIVVLGPPHEL